MDWNSVPNARAALITRGLAEITRLGLKLGARAETFQGLAGLGDLVLTCTDNQSRNRRMGLALAAGRSPRDIEHDIGQVVEGVYAAEAVHHLAKRLGVEMPITEQIYHILYQGVSPRAAFDALMARGLKSETKLSLRSVTAGEFQLPPGFVQNHGHGVGEVQAAVMRAHGNPQAPFRIHGVQQTLWQTAVSGPNRKASPSENFISV